MTEDPIVNGCFVVPKDSHLKGDLSPRWYGHENKIKDQTGSCSTLSSDDDSTVVAKDDNDKDNRTGRSVGNTPISSDAATPPKQTERSSGGMLSRIVRRETVSDAKRRLISQLKTNLSQAQLEIGTAQRVFQISQEQNVHLVKKCASLEAKLTTTCKAQETDSAKREEQQSLIEELRTEKSALSDKCDMLHNIVDKNARVVKDLQAQEAELRQNKADLEVRLLKQISSLTVSKRDVEDDYENKLKAKKDSIAHLQQQVSNQEQLIKKLSDEIRNLQQQHRQKLSKTSHKSVSEEPEHKTNDDMHSATFFESQFSGKSDLEHENEVLQEKVRVLTEVNKSLHVEVVDLRDRVGFLSNVENSVVPSLKSDLARAQEMIRVFEQNIQDLTQEWAAREESLRNALAIAASDKAAAEASYIDQLMQVEKEKTNIEEKLTQEIQEKDKVAKLSQQKTSLLQEQVIQLQSNSELESISGRGQVDMLKQLNTENEAKVSEQKKVIQALRTALSEREVHNADLVQEVKRLGKKISEIGVRNVD